jgi:hypothetical protein
MELSVDTKRPCKATINISILIAEPVNNGTWRPVCVDNVSIGVDLQGYNHQQLDAQVKQKIEEFRELWGKQIILIDNSPNNVPPPQ